MARRKSLDETIQDTNLSAAEKRFLKGGTTERKGAKKQLTVEIDQDIYDQFQLKCLQNNTKMARVVREAIEKYLGLE